VNNLTKSACLMRNQFSLATFNVLNLHDANIPFYEHEGYSTAQYNEKCDWLADQFDRLDVDILALQEIWSEKALIDCVARSKTMRNAAVVTAPGAGPGNLLPKVGLVSRLALTTPVVSIAQIPSFLTIDLPGPFNRDEFKQMPRDFVAKHREFSRPVLKAKINLGAHNDQRGTSSSLTLFVTHLKSKRPDRFEWQSPSGQLVTENLDDPRCESVARLRSLMMRGIEAAALRSLVLDEVEHTRQATIVAGDFNDSSDAVTTEIVTGRAMPFDKQGADCVLFDVAALPFSHKLRREVTYSHVHQDEPSTLDHILVSEEFLATSKFAQFKLQRLDYFNDHLNERNPMTSDHGVVRARFAQAFVSDPTSGLISH
jgi:Endonuclease/Exonuclease/phosphatase family